MLRFSGFEDFFFSTVVCKVDPNRPALSRTFGNRWFTKTRRLTIVGFTAWTYSQSHAQASLLHVLVFNKMVNCTTHPNPLCLNSSLHFYVVHKTICFACDRYSYFLTDLVQVLQKEKCSI
jgi:hypothetical protein